jgi:hypothetical protein
MDWNGRWVESALKGKHRKGELFVLKIFSWV